MRDTNDIRMRLWIIRERARLSPSYRRITPELEEQPGYLDAIRQMQTLQRTRPAILCASGRAECQNKGQLGAPLRAWSGLNESAGRKCAVCMMVERMEDLAGAL
jgi:hypothetical protein